MLADGLLILDKKNNITSFGSLGAVKKAFATKKAGHTGTLDKFATGVLLVLVGKAVKLNFMFENFIKEYTGTLRFGTETDTLDPEGEVIADGPVPSREEVEAVLETFRGEILQAPPAYSALHINGRRAYELAREGKAPEMKKRPVFIHELKIISWNAPEAVIRAKVSAGTYIRSLARDIALAAGSRAHLTALRRDAVGPFRLENTVIFDPEENDTDLIKILHPLDPELFKTLSVPYFFLDEKAADDFTNGRPLEKLLPLFVSAAHESKVAGFFKKKSPNELLGVLTRENGKWSYAHVFANN